MFVTLAIFAVWLGVILLATTSPSIGIFLPIFAMVMTIILFLIGFGSKK